MQLGETIATYNVDLALRGERGKFEVTSPDGAVFYITSKVNQACSDVQLPDKRSYSRAFLVKKIAEPISVETEGKMALENAGVQAASPVPFLIENEDEVKAETREATGSSDNNEEGAPEICDLQFHYSEGDATTKQPFALIYTGREVENGRVPRTSLTARCVSLNDLDAEIRKLQAQLEEFQSRAKKKFYQAQAAAASA